jgi:predicted dehydrogenase
MYFMDYPEVKSVSAATYSKFSNSTSWNGWSEAKSGNGIYNVEDMAVGFIRLKNGATIDFEFSWASNIEGDYNYYEILGDKGGIWFKNGQIKVFSEVLNTLVDITPNTNYPKKPIDEFEHFVNCIKDNKEPLASAEEGAKLMEIIDAAYLSAEKGVEIVF